MGRAALAGACDMSKLKPSDYWSTPDAVFAWAEERFGKFDIDVAATPENAKCPSFYTEDDDALTYRWIGRCFLNPPYSDVSPWLEKARANAYLGSTVVVLLKYDHSTQWWKKYISPDWSRLQTYPGVTVVPYPKRIKFDVPPGLLGKDGKPMKSMTPPWPSVFVVFTPPDEKPE